MISKVVLILFFDSTLSSQEHVKDEIKGDHILLRYVYKVKSWIDSFKALLYICCSDC